VLEQLWWRPSELTVAMSRSLYSPCTLPVEPRPEPLLMFIQQALLSLVYRERIVRTAEGGGCDHFFQSALRQPLNAGCRLAFNGPP